MCVHCRSPVAIVVSPVLSSSGKAASPGRELQLHVSYSLHRCPVEYCLHQRQLNVFERSLSFSCSITFLTLRWQVLLSQGSPCHCSCGSCLGFVQEDEVHQSVGGLDIPLPVQSSSFLCLPGRARGRAGCGNARGNQDAVHAPSKQAVASGGWCVMYFWQPLEEQLFPWLGSAAAGWPAQAWESAQKYTLQRLICIALIIPNKPVLSTCKYSQSVKMCHPFVFHLSFVFFLDW